MKRIGFFGHAGGLFNLPKRAVVKLIFRPFALTALILGIPASEKDEEGLEGEKKPKVENTLNKNSVNEDASDNSPKDFFPATAKIRATDREGNSIEIIY